MDLAGGSWPSGFAAVVLLQCTFATATALLVARMLKRSAAARRTMLRTGLLCALTCPMVTLGLKMGNLRLVSIPVPTLGTIAAERSTLSAERTFRVPPRTVVGTTESAIGPHRQADQSARAGSAERSNSIWPDVPSLVLLICVLGLLAIGYGIVRSWLKMRRLLGNTQTASGNSLLVAIRRTHAELAPCQFPTVVCSREVTSPVVTGIFRPVMILPGGLCERLTATELRMVLLHEAAHVVQRDHISLLLARMFTAVYWFHPLAHAVVRELARAQEEVCDNYVLQTVDGPSYGETLLRLAKLLQQMSPVSGGVGLFSLRWKLEERIAGLLDGRRRKMVRTTPFARSLIVSLMSLAMLAIGATKLTAERETAQKGDAPSCPAANRPCTRSSQKVKTVATVNGEQTNLDLIQQECKRRGVEVTEQEVRDEIGRQAKRFNISVDNWLEMLREERGIDSDSYSDEVIWPALGLRKLVADQVVVKEKEIKRAFECNYGPQVEVRAIVCRNKQHADNVHARVIADPTIFERIAKEESTEVNGAAIGGTACRIRHHAGSAQIERVAFALKKGEISDIFFVNGKYVILRCERHIERTNTTMTAEIRDDLDQAIQEKKLRQAAVELFRQLQDNAEAKNDSENKAHVEEPSRGRPGRNGIG